MTREDAIKLLWEYRDCLFGILREPIEMAIKALEQESCGDAISRKQAIKTIEKFCSPECVQVCVLTELPSVTPQEPKTGHWIDDDFGSKCSCCGIHTHLDKFDRPMKFKYCSMCGCRMQESEG